MNTEVGALTVDSGVHGSRIKSGMTRLKNRLSGLSDRLETIAEAEREQLPLWLPVGVMLGIAAWFYLADELSWSVFLFVAGAFALAALALGSGTRWGRALAWFAISA